MWRPKKKTLAIPVNKTQELTEDLEEEGVSGSEDERIIQ